jgi:AcrR family transcriptional regulator
VKNVEKRPPSPGRRQEYAEQTRQAVIEAARKLFSTRGYAQTKVDDIAALARVSPMTIYSGLGGKTGLLRILMDLWSTTPGNDIALEDIRAQTDPNVVIEKVALTVRQMRESFADIAYFMHDAAPNDPEVTANLAIATERYRAWCSDVIKHLQKLRAIRRGLSMEEATDILWFFFGYWGYYTLHNENGWTYERAQGWLTDTARQTLLRSPKG